MVRVAKTIRDAHARAGLSQSALAARARTSQPAIARYEAGTATPSFTTLERILAAAGSSLVLQVAPRVGRRRAAVRAGRLALLRGSRERLLDAARRHGVRNLRVFGSVARGEETPESDIDLLVELEPGRTLIDLIGFEQEAEDILGVGVDAAAPRFLKALVRDRALREAVPV